MNASTDLVGIVFPRKHGWWRKKRRRPSVHFLTWISPLSCTSTSEVSLLQLFFNNKATLLCMQHDINLQFRKCASVCLLTDLYVTVASYESTNLRSCTLIDSGGFTSIWKELSRHVWEMKTQHFFPHSFSSFSNYVALAKSSVNNANSSIEWGRCNTMTNVKWQFFIGNVNLTALLPFAQPQTKMIHIMIVLQLWRLHTKNLSRDILHNANLFTVSECI